MPNNGGGPKSIRLIFEYDGDEIRLIHRSEVDVALTGFDTSPEARAGRFAEVRDAEGRGLTRVPVRVDTTSAEVFPERPGDPIIRVPVQHPKGAFTVIVPAPPAAHSVALLDVGQPAPGPEGLAPSPPGSGKGEERILGVFDLEPGGRER